MSRARILVVDDLPTNRLMLKAALSADDYDMVEAADGEEALAVLAEGAFDLVILDYRMPGLSGVDVLAAIRERHRETELPVMMVSGEDDDTAAEDFINGGANDFVRKPFDFALLAAHVRTLVGYKRALDEVMALKGKAAP